MTAANGAAPRFSNATLLSISLLALALLWTYWTTLAGIAWRWSADPQYSHGYLVPLFALYVLWLRRECLTDAAPSISWLGLALVVAAIGLRLVGTRFHFEYFDHVSIVPCCLGLFLLAGGWPAFWWSWPAIAFLAFMIPLPHQLSMALAGPMQTLATLSSTFVLQVIGRPALAEGNLILINDIELNIVEACSGLRMLVVFFALSTAVAMLIRKPLWEKLLIASSAVPIALAANILRITITGLFYDAFGNNFGGEFLHDLAGWLMMPLGLMLLGIELWILGRLLIERPTDVPIVPQVSLERVEVNPLAIYAAASPRRERTPAPEPEREPEPVA